jgi:hypothetical protein
MKTNSEILAELTEIKTGYRKGAISRAGAKQQAIDLLTENLPSIEAIIAMVALHKELVP